METGSTGQTCHSGQATLRSRTTRSKALPKRPKPQRFRVAIAPNAKR